MSQYIDTQCLITSSETSEKDPTCAGLTLSTLEQTAQTSHNMYREMHERTPNICYSHEIAKTAKSWAKYLIDNNQFKSSTTRYLIGSVVLTHVASPFSGR